MDLQQAIDAFLASGSVFVNSAEDDVIVIPAYNAVDVWELAGLLNQAGLSQTDYILNADQGSGRKEQLSNLLDKINRALQDAGFSREDSDSGDRVYTRKRPPAKHRDHSSTNPRWRRD